MRLSLDFCLPCAFSFLFGGEVKENFILTKVGKMKIKKGAPYPLHSPTTRDAVLEYATENPEKQSFFGLFYHPTILFDFCVTEATMRESAT